jgi:hypothetical protein
MGLSRERFLNTDDVVVAVESFSARVSFGPNTSLIDAMPAVLRALMSFHVLICGIAVGRGSRTGC